MYQENPLRTLAWSSKWQALYSQSLELSNSLFHNTADFTPIQIIFLKYLQLYHYLYSQLGREDKSLLTIEVIESEILCDAYLLYEKQQRMKPVKDSTSQVRDSHKLTAHLPPSLVFKN